LDNQRQEVLLPQIIQTTVLPRGWADALILVDKLNPPVSSGSWEPHFGPGLREGAAGVDQAAPQLVKVTG
jgi:hypothetical protein